MVKNEFYMLILFIFVSHRHKESLIKSRCSMYSLHFTTAPSLISEDSIYEQEGMFLSSLLAVSFPSSQ